MRTKCSHFRNLMRHTAPILPYLTVGFALCSMTTGVRAEPFGYRFTPLGSPGMASVALHSDPEQLPERGLLAKDGMVYTLGGQRIGLFDAEHTTVMGIQLSYPGTPHEIGNYPGHVPMDYKYTNVRGQVIGTSVRGLGGHIDSVWLYDPASEETTWLGYVDADNDDPTALGHAGLRSINDAGDVLGVSYYGESSAAWLYGSDTREYKSLGLSRESVATEGAPRVSVRPVTLDGAGNVAGTTTSYDELGNFQTAVWYHAAGEVDARPIGPTPQQFRPVSIVGRTSQGHILGAAWSATESSAFVYDPATDETHYLNNTVDEQALADGMTTISWIDTTTFQRQHPGPLPYALGAFNRYRDNVLQGQSVWHYDLSTQQRTRLGPRSAEYGIEDGREFSEIITRDANRVIGASRSYGVDDYHGKTIWMHDVASATTRDIGLDDADVRRADGIATNRVTELRKDGRILGEAVLTRGQNTSIGAAAWLFDPATGVTTRHGLYGSDVWQQEGTIATSIVDVNAAGYVVGQSEFTHGENGTHGSAAWLFDPTTGQTKRLGLFGDAFRREDGYQESTIFAFGPRGHVLGMSDYGRAQSLPCEPEPFCERLVFATAWMYDPDLGETIELETSNPTTTAKLLGLLSIAHMDEEGSYIGSCVTEVVPTFPPAYHTSACMWTRDGGLVDLNDVIVPSIAGWHSVVLESINARTSSGLLVGTMRADGKTFPFLLTPVPEPEVVKMLASLAVSISLFAVRSRKR